MKTFREQLGADLDSVFFNLDEFGEIHKVDGVEVPVVVDNDKLMELDMGKNVETNGVYTDDKIFYIKREYISYEPCTGQIMDFDGHKYPIRQVLDDMGGYTIILRGNES